MQPSPGRHKNYWIAAGALLVAALAVGLITHRPQVRARRLADGTLLFYRRGSTALPQPGYPRPRAIRLDGDVWVVAGPGAAPLLLQSRLLQLAVDSGSALRVTAFANETGEQAEVLRGHVIARKAYPSNDAAPDTLEGGEMIMVNQTIDLMEKEKDPPEAIQRWSEELIQAAGPVISWAGAP